MLPSIVRLALRHTAPLRAGPCFEVPDAGASFTLEAQEVKRCDVTFAPTMGETFSAHVEMHVADNPFEATRVTLRGEGFDAIASFDDLPGGVENTVDLGFGTLRSRFAVHAVM